MSSKTVDVTTAMLKEREALLKAVNSSGLPATISELLVKELYEAVHAKAVEEYAASGAEEGGK